MRILLVLFTYLLISCNSQADKNEAIDSPTVLETNKEMKLLYSETKSPEKIENILPEKQLQITVVKSYTNTYVTKVSPKNTYKYKDIQMHLTIKQKSEVILDTIFRKENFVQYTSKKYIANSTLSEFFFMKNQNRIEFLGRLESNSSSSPQFLFSFYFDLKDKTLKFIELTKEDRIYLN